MLLYKGVVWKETGTRDFPSRVHLCIGPAYGPQPAPVVSGQWYLADEVLEW